MTTSSETTSQQLFVSRALEAAIRIGLVVLLVAWCFQIVRPFITPIVWGAIIAVAAYPGYRWLQLKLGGRPTESFVSWIEPGTPTAQRRGARPGFGQTEPAEMDPASGVGWALAKRARELGGQC